jgi:hypothetical protein
MKNTQNKDSVGAKSVAHSVKDCNTITTSQFILALVAVLLGAILVNLWIRVINNFNFNFLGLNQDSFWWTLLIALTFTGVLIAYIAIAFDDDTSNQIKARISGLSLSGTVANSSNFVPNDTSDFNETVQTATNESVQDNEMII